MSVSSTSNVSIEWKNMAAELNNVCEVVDNWEDIDENKMFQKSLAISEPIPQPLRNGQLVIREDSTRSQYMSPEPSVKILKRPSREERLNNASTETNINGNGKPVKTLRQREAEYAEARLRILGRATSSDEHISDRLTVTESTSGHSSAVYTLLRPTCDSTKCPDNVIRQPRGPTDSHGFNLRR